MIFVTILYWLTSYLKVYNQWLKCLYYTLHTSTQNDANSDLATLNSVLDMTFFFHPLISGSKQLSTAPCWSGGEMALRHGWLFHILLWPDEHQACSKVCAGHEGAHWPVSNFWAWAALARVILSASASAPVQRGIFRQLEPLWRQMPFRAGGAKSSALGPARRIGHITLPHG